MKKIFLLLTVVTLAAASGQAQRHYRVRGYGGYHGGYYARPYYGYGRPHIGLGIGLWLGFGLGYYANPYPYYGYPYGYGYAYPPGYVAPPPPAYNYSNPPPASDSTGTAPQQYNDGNNDGSYNPGPQQGNGSASGDNTQGPKPARTWVASHWEHRSTGWVWVEGYWK